MRSLLYNVHGHVGYLHRVLHRHALRMVFFLWLYSANAHHCSFLFYFEWGHRIFFNEKGKCDDIKWKCKCLSFFLYSLQLPKYCIFFVSIFKFDDKNSQKCMSNSKFVICL